MACSEEKLTDIFQKAETSGDGVVTPVELKKLIQNEFGNDISNEDLVAMFCALDRNGDGVITLEEFLKEMSKKDRRTAFSEKFKELDKEGCGKLSKDVICQMLKEENFDDDQINEMFSHVDTNDDGVISREEFMAMV
ncbi:uncharacterized protein LOC132545851 [Ylistrum balloti]|uniref:uncharacterized protein LOC132545851 n=1 Tax=Ylistrum balloti TaxID=509963 RepID=UPI0029058AFF|nr:uncharacterized protein LOC132545851 [Ylistrum balloti]